MVTTTTHKTLGGPRGGVILSKAELAKKINSAVFPGQQGGPLEHVIAAKAVAFKMAATDDFRDRQERTLEGAALIAERLMADDVRDAGITVLTGGTEVHLVLVDLRNSALDGQQAEDRLHRIGITVLSGGTDVHLVLVDLRDSEVDGQQAEDRLHEVGITVNRNAVPFDPRPPMVSSGVRIGTPALATRGFDAEAFAEVADVIAETLAGSGEEGVVDPHTEACVPRCAYRG